MTKRGKKVKPGHAIDKVVNVLDKDTFTIRIVNAITYQQTKLTITKQFTIKDVQEAYHVYENHPEYYLWTDMYGRTLELNKTVVENELVGADEVVEFDGIGKLPVIILIFKDGFENEIPATLNPLNYGSKELSLCRNY